MSVVAPVQGLADAKAAAGAAVSGAISNVKGMMSRGGGDANRACHLGLSGAFLHIGPTAMALNPLGYDFKQCIMSKMPVLKCCCSFTPTLTYTDAGMTKGAEYVKTKKGALCCTTFRYEVYKLSNFQPLKGAQTKELLAYTFRPSRKAPCWYKILGVHHCLTCGIAVAGSAVSIVFPPAGAVAYAGLALWCGGNDKSYATFCSSETVEYGIKDGKTNELTMTFQNDASGFQKAFCCKLGSPSDDKCANCKALKNYELFRNVHRTIFNGSSKAGVHKGQPPREPLATFTRTSVMHPALPDPNGGMCQFPAFCCCAVEKSPHLGHMRIDYTSDAVRAAQTEDQVLASSLLLFAADSDWSLIDCCIDDIEGRGANSVQINSSGDDKHVHASVTFSNFQGAMVNGLVDTGSFVDDLKAKMGR